MAPLHLVSAWACADHVVLGQVATDARSNEITAIPALLRTLVLTDTVVTIDAMGCQKAIAKQIVQGGGDSVLALKEHQETLHELVAYHFARGETPVEWRQVTKEHGRLEIRTCQATAEPAILTWLDPKREWRGLHSIAAVTGERRIGETVTRETRYFVSSLPADAARIGQAVRAHWGIENGLHWVLDVAFREDESRVRTGYAAENLSRTRRLALMLLKREPTATVGIKARRLMGGWDESFLAKVLAA